MRSSLRLALAATLAVTSLAPVSAKIYPDDFTGPLHMQQSAPTPPTSTPVESIPLEMGPTAPVTTDAMGSPLFSTKPGLTRGEFLSAITYSLYTWDQHKRCFAEIAGGSSDYQLLFNDVRVDNENSAAICMAMRNGWVDGYKDGTFRPNDVMTVADGAAVLTRIFGLKTDALKKGQAWYTPYMNAVTAADKNFALKAKQQFTGIQLYHTLCKLQGSLSETGSMLHCGGMQK